MIGALILLVHAALYLLILALYGARKLKLDVPVLLVAACLPVVGDIMVAVLARMRARELEGARVDQLPDLARPEDSEIQANPDDADDRDVVPLEDALIVDDAPTRRRAMVSALLGDSKDYMSSIASARNNEDTEVSHYASTAMAEFSKASEERYRQLGEELERDPDGREVLVDFLDFMEQYLASGLLQGQLLEDMRARYLHLLQRKHVVAETVADDEKLVVELLRHGHLNEAGEVLGQMDALWPDSQDVWYTAMRYCVARNDRQGVQDLVSHMERTEGFKTPRVREALEFWGQA